MLNAIQQVVLKNDGFLGPIISGLSRRSCKKEFLQNRINTRWDTVLILNGKSSNKKM